MVCNLVGCFPADICDNHFRACFSQRIAKLSPKQACTSRDDSHATGDIEPS
jgi:hypothetical protein